ncbi:30S ribosomal protein S12 [Candidatus Micrarchaeota archaeon]|nr:30S ribosomal protein S12 [Candidatus Micrarchaeota archaeon]
MGKGEFSGRNMQKKRKKMRWLSKRWKRKKLKLWAKYSVLGKAPLGKGIVLEKKTLEQKQPHSGLIKCVKVQLIKNGRVATAFAPRNGAINYIDEHDEVVIDGLGGSQRGQMGSIPGVRFKVIKVNNTDLQMLRKGKKEKPRR